MFLSFCVLDDFFCFSKFLGFWVFFVHPTVVWVLLSASVKRFFVSRMRDFFQTLSTKFSQKSSFHKIFPLNLSTQFVYPICPPHFPPNFSTTFSTHFSHQIFPPFLPIFSLSFSTKFFHPHLQLICPPNLFHKNVDQVFYPIFNPIFHLFFPPYFSTPFCPPFSPTTLSSQICSTKFLPNCFTQFSTLFSWHPFPTKFSLTWPFGPGQS